MYTLPFVKKYLVFLIIAGFIIAGTGLFAETVNYTYDDLNRLIKVTYGDGTVVEYEYDKAGNRTKQKTTVSDTTPPTVTATSPSNGATVWQWIQQSAQPSARRWIAVP